MKGYKSRKGINKKHRKFVVIVCEGEVTEIQYFDGFNEHRYSGVKIVPLHGRCTDALNIAKCAVKQIQEYEVDFEDGDSVWCVFDFDDKPLNTITDAVAHCEANNVNVALSNPSFELWFLLHHKKVYARLGREEVLQDLIQYIKDYGKSYNAYPELKDKLKFAIENSKKQCKLIEEKKIEFISKESSSYTHVYKLVEHILQIIKENTVKK